MAGRDDLYRRKRIGPNWPTAFGTLVDLIKEFADGKARSPATMFADREGAAGTLSQTRAQAWIPIVSGTAHPDARRGHRADRAAGVVRIDQPVHG